MPLSGRAVVTGGGRGIGENIARELAAAGMRVLVTGRTKARVEAVLANEPGPSRDVVILNAAAALYVAGVVPSLWDGVAAAREALATGAARAKLDELVRFTRRFAKAS